MSQGRTWPLHELLGRGRALCLLFAEGIRKPEVNKEAIEKTGFGGSPLITELQTHQGNLRKMKILHSDPTWPVFQVFTHFHP